MKKILALAFAATMLLAMTGCSKESLNEAADTISRYAEADGRDFGNTKTAEIGETLENNFFSMKVNSVYATDELNGYYFDDDSYEIVCVNVTATNTWGDTINVGTYDYVLRYGEGDSDYCSSTDQIADGADTAYPESKDIGNKESVTGDIFFTVPADATDLKLEYVEVYEDDFEGSVYQILLGDPEKK